MVHPLKWGKKNENGTVALLDSLLIHLKIYSNYLNYWDKNDRENKVDLDQTAQNVQFDHGLHFFPIQWKTS